jgi:hypothetical protein
MILAVGLLVPVVAACGSPAASQQQTVTTTAAAPATAQPVHPDPKVGAVFLGAGSLHTCTGSVLHSATGNLILTAAHCLAGGFDTTFVAGFNDQAAPENIWRVEAVYLDPRWVQNQDPMADFAIARVTRDAGGSVESQAGGGLALGSTPTAGTTVTVTGYGLGEGGGPIGCQAPTAIAAGGFPSLPCEGLIDGTSGAPWTTGSTVTGLIGGLDGGGCQNNVSYSPPFDGRLTQLLTRAEAGGAGDDAPNVLDDNC